MVENRELVHDSTPEPNIIINPEKPDLAKPEFDLSEGQVVELPDNRVPNLDKLLVSEEERHRTGVAEARQRILAAEAGRTKEAQRTETEGSVYPHEIIKVDRKEIKVLYVPKEVIFPAFGYFQGDTVQVRTDLPARVQRFVRAHEIYHATDKAKWGGWLGRELRASVML